MRNLFVIGNGFDLAHNMKTGFNHFRDYLSTNYSILHNYAPYVPEAITEPLRKRTARHYRDRWLNRISFRRGCRRHRKMF